MNLKNLFSTAIVCALLALSHSGHAKGPDANTLMQAPEPAVAASVQAKEPGTLTVAQVQQLQKRVIKGPAKPAGPGTSAQSIKATPGGPQEFDACCTSCGPGGCTGCNSGPNGLNCGIGRIAADCQVVEDKVTCVKKDE